LSLDGFLRGNLEVLGRFSSKNTANAKLTSQALNLSRHRHTQHKGKLLREPRSLKAE